MCRRWDYLTNFFWNIKSLKISTVENTVTVDSPKAEKLMTFNIFSEIVQRIAPSIRYFDFLNYLCDNEPTICKFGEYIFQVNEGFQFTVMLEILSNNCCNAIALKVKWFKPIHNVLWNQFIENNQRLISFELQFIESILHNAICESEYVCDHNRYIEEILGRLPNTLENVKLTGTFYFYSTNFSIVSYY